MVFKVSAQNHLAVLLNSRRRQLRDFHIHGDVFEELNG